jgi:hypothetical protein
MLNRLETNPDRKRSSLVHKRMRLAVYSTKGGLSIILERRNAANPSQTVELRDLLDPIPAKAGTDEVATRTAQSTTEHQERG